MGYRFNPCYYGIRFRSRNLLSLVHRLKVSILVIMEFALEDLSHVKNLLKRRGFNPCYYGIRFRSPVEQIYREDGFGFNPCYYGIGFRSFREVA